MDTVKENLSYANANLITNGVYEAIRIYWNGPNFTRRYGAMYFQDGNIVSRSCLKGYELKEKYLGK